MKKVIEVRQVEPTRIPFECPVCNGYGTVGKTEIKTCHGCNGLGWVVVEQNSEDYIDATDII